jgi:hypothetical protein
VAEPGFGGLVRSRRLSANVVPPSTSSQLKLAPFWTRKVTQLSSSPCAMDETELAKQSIVRPSCMSCCLRCY